MIAYLFYRKQRVGVSNDFVAGVLAAMLMS